MSAIQTPTPQKSVTVYLKDYDRFNAGKTDEAIADMKAGKLDIYDNLNGFVGFLKNKGTLSARSIGFAVKGVKHFLDIVDVDISDRKFHNKVKLPKAVKTERAALEKADFAKIINACEDIRLRTFIMFLASTACRATEALMIKIGDIDFSKNPIVVNIPGENTKTKQDHHVYLTAEMAKQLQTWFDYNYRERTIKARDGRTDKWVKRVIAPQKSPNDYVFLPAKETKPKKVKFKVQYSLLYKRFTPLIERLDYNQGKVTVHVFRHFVYSTIDSLGMNQYAEWYLSHATSEYWNKSEKEKVASFKKAEPYLTYTDITALEATTQDLTTRLEATEKELQALRKAVHKMGFEETDEGIEVRDEYAFVGENP